jgi:hypothetical protein
MGIEVLTGVQATGKPAMRLGAVIGVHYVAFCSISLWSGFIPNVGILLFLDVTACREDDEMISYGFFISLNIGTRFRRIHIVCDLLEVLNYNFTSTPFMSSGTGTVGPFEI